jgi:hypothetical protein
MDRLQEVKTFTELNADAIAHTVDYGIAKIPNFLGQSALELLNRRFGSEDGGRWDPVVLGMFPDFEPIYEHLYNDVNIRNGMGVRLSSEHLDPSGDKESHQDALSPKGVSILLPYYGPEALFAASSSPFVLSPRTFEANPPLINSPEWLTTYGVRDAILLRQGIDRFNGQNKKLEQEHHVGVAASPRKLFTIDFVTTNLVTDLAAAA